MRKGAGFAAALLAACLCVGCGSVTEKPEIEVALWSIDVYSDYMEQVEKMVPGVKIKWVKAQRDLGYYKELAEAGELPDILSVRKFSMKDSLDLNQYLQDLSGTELTSAYYDLYLENYRTSNREVFWIPMSGTVDGIVANKALFDQYQIPLPTDFDSFIYACREFEQYGIQGYYLNMDLEYNALHLLQGLGIETLSTVEGSMWRSAYESGLTEQMDPGVWMPAFEKVQRLMEAGIFTARNWNEDDSLSYQRMNAGKQAMAHISSESITRELPGLDVEILPYFGESENFLLNYPVFQLALNREVNEDQDKAAAAWEVLMAMASPEAQKILNNHTDGLIPYRRDVTFEYRDCMLMVQPYIDANQMYIRLGAENFFDASKKTVENMWIQDLSAEEGFTWMNQYLRQLSIKKASDEIRPGS